MSEVLGVIPARGGSKGIPRKNLKELAGKPLIAHQIESALASEEIDRTIVSTDDEEIASTAREFGADVPFSRPSAIAEDDVPVIAVYKHAKEWFDERNESPTSIVGLQPTCPFTLPSEINEAVRKLEEKNCDSVVSVAEVTETHPYRSYVLEEDRLLPFEDVTVEEPLQRQDRPTVYGLTGAIFARSRSVLDDWDYDTFALGSDVRTVVQTEEQKLDIDSSFELRIARALASYEDS
jgi:CMP-N-acetylneuraminic acid synthetase